jgi:predicted nucleic acid-binding protein
MLILIIILSLIAAIALDNRVPIWHRDRDFTAIARFTVLEIIDAT